MIHERYIKNSRCFLCFYYKLQISHKSRNQLHVYLHGLMCITENTTLIIFVCQLDRSSAYPPQYIIEQIILYSDQTYSSDICLLFYSTICYCLAFKRQFALKKNPKTHNWSKFKHKRQYFSPHYKSRIVKMFQSVNTAVLSGEI